MYLAPQTIKRTNHLLTNQNLLGWLLRSCMHWYVPASLALIWLLSPRWVIGSPLQSIINQSIQPFNRNGVGFADIPLLRYVLILTFAIGILSWCGGLFERSRLLGGIFIILLGISWFIAEIIIINGSAPLIWSVSFGELERYRLFSEHIILTGIVALALMIPIVLSQWFVRRPIFLWVFDYGALWITLMALCMIKYGAISSMFY
ncbi:MAG TPA: hypothetical protein DEF47_17880 [Herpetosiphon sp.]|nr:hypothetical protein [Herpetosiphon sp.]HBW51766.1 hypothetical protein [Herpetosiphon sp.]